MADIATNSGAYMNSYHNYERKIYSINVNGLSEQTIRDYINQFKEDKFGNLKSTIMNNKI